MRLYEFSKQCNVPAKTLIQDLADAGIIVKSHMAVLSDEAVSLLEKKYNPVVVAKEKSAPVEVLPVVEKKIIQKVAEEKPAIKTTQKKLPEAAQTVLNEQVKEASPVAATPLESDKKVYLEPQSVVDFAAVAGKPVNDVILTMLKWGIASSKNQLIPQETVARLARHYEMQIIHRPQAASEQFEEFLQTKTAKGHLLPRAPIVVVIGHVDHGKTTLLDFIRKTRVVAKEKGGITQHLGAYQVKTKQGDVVFLDTPGHEAFIKMRQRGVRVADVAVLVVAADDGVMPQTVEAIKHARQMNVPIVIAANKIDKVGKERLDVIKRQLAQHDVLVEDWGGSVVFVPISAKSGEGIDQLLEMIILQTDLMDLRADHDGAAKGFVLEARIEKGLGPVATLIVQHGTLHAGDYFSSGSVSGRVTSLVDCFGKRLAKVGPAIPIQVSGFSELPNAGDFFQVVVKQEYKKVVGRDEPHVTMAGKHLHPGAENLIIKTDSNASKEALLSSIEAVSKRSDKNFNVIHAVAGDINESDVELAFNTGSEIIGLHVKAEPKAVQLAQRKNVTIHQYDIIYRLLEALELQGKNKEVGVSVRTKIGEARVLKVFDIKNIGVVAGCVVSEGRFSRDGFAMVWRGTYKIGEGKISSLQRDKRAVKEVHTGFECGFIVEGVSDWKADDRVECYLNLPAATKTK